MIYDVIVIGIGSANMFFVLEMIKKGFKGKMLLIEAGKRIEERDWSKDVMKGFGGSGVCSDCKIVISSQTGGSIESYLSKETIDKLQEDFIGYLKDFHEGEFEYIVPDSSEINKYKPFELIVNKTLHLGTEFGRVIAKKIQKHIEEQPNIEILYNTSVTDIWQNENDKKSYYVEASDKSIYKGIHLMYATGKSGVQLTKKIIERFDIKTDYKEPQIGIRVVVPHEITAYLTNKYYDFKLILNQDKGSARSFCVSPWGVTIVEKLHGNLTFNGGSNKKSKTKKTNFGILAVPKDIGNMTAYEFQRKVVKGFNDLGIKKMRARWDDWNKRPEIKEIFGDVFDLVTNWMIEFDKVASGFLDNVLVYFPEVKYASEKLPLENNLNLKGHPNWYICGDSSYSRGIFQSSIGAIYAAQQIIEEVNANETK